MVVGRGNSAGAAVGAVGGLSYASAGAAAKPT